MLEDNISKKSQFYIITAIIIVFVISALASVATYSVIKSEPRNVQEMSEYLRIEVPKVIDYGVYDGKDVTSLVEDFTNKDFATYFASKAGDDTNITFIYGNGDNIKGKIFSKKNTGGLYFGSAEWKLKEVQTEIPNLKIETDPEDPNIKYVTISGEKYKFYLKPGSTFYFLLKRSEGDEIYVEKNEAGREARSNENAEKDKKQEADGMNSDGLKNKENDSDKKNNDKKN